MQNYKMPLQELWSLIRDAGQINNILDQLLSSGAEVILGGRAAYFYPQSAKESKRKDENNLIENFKSKGYQVAFTQQDLISAAENKNTVEKYPNQPDLTEMNKSAIDVLSRNPNGFLLMVKAALIDKFNHHLD